MVKKSLSKGDLIEQLKALASQKTNYQKLMGGNVLLTLNANSSYCEM